MAVLTFYGFMDYEGNKIARFETVEPEEIPINIFVNNYEDVKDMPEDVYCSFEVYGIGTDIAIYNPEDEYMASSPSLASKGLIPMGTFPVDSNKDTFYQNPNILFSGMVSKVYKNDDPQPDEYDFMLVVESYSLTFNLYLQYKENIEVGAVVHGTAWLYADLPCEE
ncbi:MAG: hypothetical protein LIO49_07030 [Ruminococcus sp.]|nr:hypothetical protein [Ruminococcus sp.]